MKEQKKDFKDEALNKKVKELLKKSKELNLIKPLTTAFEKNNCKEEQHKGKKESFCR